MKIRLEGTTQEVHAVLTALRSGHPLAIGEEFGPYANRHHRLDEVRVYVTAAIPIQDEPHR